jgi:hypothetical protein
LSEHYNGDAATGQVNRQRRTSVMQNWLQKSIAEPEKGYFFLDLPKIRANLY